MTSIPISLPNEKYSIRDNLTNIFFNEKFKLFIKKTREHINEKYNPTNIDTEFMEKKHTYLKTYVMQNKSQIDLINNKLNIKPDMFAINICLLTDISSYSYWTEIDVTHILSSATSINDVFRSTTFCQEYAENNWCKLLAEENVSKRNCCCSKTNIAAINVFLVQSLLYSARFGCDCVDKFFIDNHKKSIKIKKFIKISITEFIKEKQKEKQKQFFKTLSSKLSTQEKPKPLENTVTVSYKKDRKKSNNYNEIFITLALNSTNSYIQYILFSKEDD